MTAGIVLLGISIFFAGAAFQEAIGGTDWDNADGGYANCVIAASCFFVAYHIIMSARRSKR